MILSAEQGFLKGRDQFDQMVAFVRTAAADGRAIDAVERGLWGRLLALGHAMLGAFVAGVGTGDLGPTVEHGGRTLRRLGRTHARRYVSVFGELSVERHVYGTRETQEHESVPTDARLGLPEGAFSYVLQDWDQELCAEGPYAEARGTVSKILGLGQSVDSLERMTLAMAATAGPFLDARPAPAPPTPPTVATVENATTSPTPILVLTSDGKGIPMRKDGPAQTGRRTKGQKANKKRMACVGAVYTIDPFVRTADDVVDEVMRKAAAGRRPAPQGKQVRAELTREIDGVAVNGKDRIFAWLQRCVASANPQGAMPVVCVMDGERALWRTLATYLTGVVCILDVFHMLERLWQAAHCFCPEGSDAAQAFVTQRLKRVLEGDVGRVVGGLRQMATKHGIRGAKLKQLNAAVGYLHNNRRFMRYDEYLAAGYPIGSGVAEGACRHLVKDRMERTGMRWVVPSAQAMLDLRAVHASDQWDEFQTYRIDAESRRLYPDKELIDAAWPAAA